MNTIIPWIIYF